VVDIGRDAGRVRGRLYPDSDEEFDIEWYQARDDAPLLGCPSAINNLALVKDAERDLYPLVGEIPYARFTKRPNRIKPLATGGHRCGTEEDFAGDGAIDFDSPDVEYRADGLPRCCGEMFEGAGGLVAGGSADVVPVYVGAGGLVNGGSADVVPAFVGLGGLVAGGSATVVAAIAGTGGLVAGGSADVIEAASRVGTGGLVAGGSADVIAAALRIGTGGLVADGSADVVEGALRIGTGGLVADGSADTGAVEVREGTGGLVAEGTADVEASGSVTPPPGSSCATAPDLALDTDYEWTTVSGVTQSWHSAVPNGNYHLDSTGLTSTAGPATATTRLGSSCAGMGTLTPTGSPCVNRTVSAGHMWLFVVNASGPPGLYTFRLSAGNC